MDNTNKNEFLEWTNKGYKLYYVRFKERVRFLERLFNQDLIEDEEYIAEVVEAEKYIESKIDVFKRKIEFFGLLNHLDLRVEAEKFAYIKKRELGLN